MDEKSDIFNTDAAAYDAWFDSPDGRILFGNELAAIRLLWHDRLHPGLEVGVGTGRFAAALGIEDGVDPAAGALLLAAARGIRVTRGKGEALPWSDGLFAGVLIVATLCFTDDPAAVMHEAARVLRPDGRLLVGEIPADSAWGRVLTQKKSGGHAFYRNARLRTVAQWQELIGEAGMEVESVSSTLRQPPGGPARIEPPRLGQSEGAGFVCLFARRTQVADAP